MSPEHQNLVRAGKAIFAGAVRGESWESPKWSLAKWTQGRSHHTTFLNLHFTLHARAREATPIPMPYSDVLKASLLLYWSRTRCDGAALAKLIMFWRILVRNMINDRCESFSDLTIGLIDDSIDREKNRGRSETWLISFVGSLRVLAREIDHWRLTPEPLNFQRSMPTQSRTAVSDHRRLIEEGGREGAHKLPALRALETYAKKISNHPIDDDERVILRVIDLLIVLGLRLGEILTLPLDCWVEESIADENGRPSFDGAGRPLTRCGLRFFPEKAEFLTIDWLADQDVEVARRAVMELTRLCQPARDVARRQAENLGRIWRFRANKMLTVEEGMEHFSYTSPKAFIDAMRQRGIRRASNGNGASIRFRAGDLEKAYKRGNDRNLIPIRGERGAPILRLHDALCVCFYGQFAPSRHFVNRTRPEIISGNDVRRSLGGHRQSLSVFDRRDLFDGVAQGKRQRYKITPHSLRHYKNAIYDRSGMSDVHQSWAMHRNDISATRAYQHPTAAESAAPMREFLASTHEQRTAWLQKAISEGAIGGPLADAYADLALRDMEDAQAFLRTHAAAAHVTEFGICTNDFSIEPCRKWYRCFDNCKHYHRTGNPHEERTLKELQKAMKANLAAMEISAEGEYGGERWVQDAKQKLVGVAQALKLRPRNRDEKMAVFPNGEDHGAVPTEEPDVLG